MNDEWAIDGNWGICVNRWEHDSTFFIRHCDVATRDQIDLADCVSENENGNNV